VSKGGKILARLPLRIGNFFMVISNEFDEILGRDDVDGLSDDVCGGEFVCGLVFWNSMVARSPCEHNFNGLIASLNEGFLNLQDD